MRVIDPRIGHNDMRQGLPVKFRAQVNPLFINVMIPIVKTRARTGINIGGRGAVDVMSKIAIQPVCEISVLPPRLGLIGATVSEEFQFNSLRPGGPPLGDDEGQSTSRTQRKCLPDMTSWHPVAAKGQRRRNYNTLVLVKR